ncbi:MAG: LamG-like jellyroll fold domain-containing protein [Bacteroidia bacterium]
MRITCYPLALCFSLIFFCGLHSGLFAQGGYTLDFDGASSYAELPYHAVLNPATNFSIECWVKVEGGAGTYRSPLTSRSFSGVSAGYLIYASAANEWEFWTGQNTASWDNLNSGITVSSEWTHLAGTFDGTTKRFYINGEEVATAAGNYTPNTTMPLRVGAGNTESTPDYYFPGKLDEVRIWSDTRTQAEIQANMYKSLTGSEANLEVYFKMSDGSGAVLTDNSANSNDGILYNSPEWKTSGAFAGPGMTLDFDGTDDYVQLPASILNLASPYTIESWIYPTDFTQIATWRRRVLFLAGTPKFSLAVYENQKIAFRSTYGPVTFTSADTIAGNTWTHIALVYDGSSFVLLINGEEATLNAGGMTNAGNGSYSAIGCTSNGEGPFQGQIDEVRLWDDARTPEEIRANMFRSLDGDEDNLVAYYRFDQQSNSTHTTLYDITGNGYNGTMTNMDAASDRVSASFFSTWIGSEDSDWSNGENWGRLAAPTTENVGIYGWAGNHIPASGDISARNFYVDAGVVINHSGNLTLSGDYYNAGTFSSTGIQSFSGSSRQNIRGTGTTTFGTFTINNPAGVRLFHDLTTTGSLTLTNGILSLNSQTLTLDDAAVVAGSPDGNRHVHATSGNLRKNYSGTGSFLFPVGDSTLYTPITLNFTSGLFASGYASVFLTPTKHPNNGSVNHFINRYWTVNSSGISSFLCDITAQYDDLDISGTESVLHGGKWNGANWISLGSVNDGANTIIGTVNSFSDFTAGEESTLLVEAQPNSQPEPSIAEANLFYPNPVKDNLTIISPEGFHTLVLINMEGKILYKTLLTEGEQILSLSGLPAGPYFLRIKDATGASTDHILLKE